MTISDLTPLEVGFLARTGDATDIVFFSICEFADKAFGENHWDDPKYSYAKLQDEVDLFIKENPDVHYYCAPREDFSYWKAGNQTRNLGKHYCIVEDLS